MIGECTIVAKDNEKFRAAFYVHREPKFISVKTVEHLVAIDSSYGVPKLLILSIRQI